MVTVEVMNVTTVCQSFPELEEPQIRRENIINAIDETMFNAGIKLVAVEGNEGIGRTTLLAQFALEHNENAISLFLKPESRWGCDLKMIQADLCNQIHWITNEEEIKTFEDVDDGLMRSLLFQLQRNARRKNRLYYFIVDGLDEISTTDRETREAILDILPWNVPQFKFLLSCQLADLPSRICHRIKCKAQLLTPVSFLETAQYFADLQILENSLRDIHKVCFGMPSRMASVRRILLSGTQVTELLSETTSKNAGLFEIEWKAVSTEDSDQMAVLSMLAYSQRQLSVEELSGILSLNPDQIMSQVARLRFLSLDRENGQISWISEGFHKFAQAKLVSMKDTVTDLIIKDLQSAPQSPAALLYLPTYLNNAGRLDELLGYFSPDTLTRLIETTHSLHPLEKTADLGMQAAMKLQKQGDLMSFSLYKSIVAELDTTDIWQSEIAALMRLGKYDEALALSQSARLHEDRLNLVAVIARIRRQQGLDVEKELIEQIYQLYDQVEPVSLGSERAVKLASNLVFTVPDLAIDVVERAASAEPGENSLDWAFALLSLPALLANKTEFGSSNTIETIRSKIKASSASLFSAEYGLLLGGFSADYAIREAEKLDNTSDKIQILRMWTRANRRREDAISVVEYALKLVIKTGTYVPNATVFLELSVPLPFVQDHDKSKHLIGILDSQRQVIERQGPTEDHVRLQLLLAEAESTYDFDAAKNRIIDIYLYISELKQDLMVKTDCMAYLLATIDKIDPDKSLDLSDKIFWLVENEIQSSVDTLLEVSADHDEVIKGIVQALSGVRNTYIHEVIQRLNTQRRRDSALLLLVKFSIKTPAEKIDFRSINQAVGEFKDIRNRNAATAKVMERLYTETMDMTMQADSALPIIGRVADITSAEKRCKALCQAYSFLHRVDVDKYRSMLSHLSSDLDKAWESIDDGWSKVDAGFKIADFLSTCAPDIAGKYLRLSVEHREKMVFDNRNAASAYFASLKLAARAYGGLLPTNLATKDDLEELIRLIDILPSNGERILLYSDLALIHYLNGRYDECKWIVAEHLRPLFENISLTDIDYHDRMLAEVAPALYCCNKISTLEKLQKLPDVYRELSYQKICEFLLKKIFFGDPCDNFPGDGYDLTWDELVEVCSIIELMERDAPIFGFIQDIVDSMLRPRYKYTREQIADVARRLKDIISKRLPDRIGIQHAGWKIVSLAQIARLEHSSFAVWTELIEKARGIPNLADRSLSLAMVAEAMPSKEGIRRSQLLEEAAELVGQIPIVLERIWHYEDLAEMAGKIDQVKRKEYIKVAMQQAVTESDPRLLPIQRRLVDFAHRIDSSFASSLVSMADDDPARAHMRDTLRNRLKINEVKKKMLDPDVDVWSLSSSVMDYANAAWMSLGALNSKRIAPVHFDRVQELLRISSELNISDAYPILAWSIQNVIERNSRTDQAGRYLRPMFNAALLGAQLSTAMAIRSQDKLKQIRMRAVPNTNNEGVIVRAGAREFALNWLSNWIETKVKEYLIICDSYILPDDLKIVKMVRSLKPECRIHIITSKKNQNQERVAQPWDVAYREYWKRLSDEDPPDVDILIIGSKSNGELPVHDRWWVSSEGGIRLGTSFKSLGENKDSEISTFSLEETERIKETLNEYVYNIKREHRGEKLEYFRFSL